MPEFDILEMGTSCSSICEEIINENLERRVLVLNGNISDNIIEEYMLMILKWNLEDKDKPRDKRDPIYIYINSCGGDVFVGFNFIDVIKSSITPVYAVAFSFVASMAFMVYIACEKRYAFKNSILLMHDGDISISNSSSKAKDTMNFVDSMENRERQHVIDHTNITEEFFDDNHRKETYMYANTDGRKYGCVDFIIGEDATIEDIM